MTSPSQRPRPWIRKAAFASWGTNNSGQKWRPGECREFKLSNDEIGRIRTIVANHMRFSLLAQRMETEREAPSGKAIYRFFRDTGPAGVDLILLGLADVRGARGPALTDRVWSAFVETARILLENYWERPQESVAPPRLVDGAELMHEYDLQAGSSGGRDAARHSRSAGGR